MKLVWRGKFKDKAQLEQGELPEGAVKFKEPNSFLKLNLVAFLFMLPVFVLIGIIIYIKREMGMYGNNSDVFNAKWVFLALLGIIPHELIHAALFPKEAEVHVWYSLKHLLVFVHSVCPMSKKRFIWMSLMPSIVFGLLPLILWLFIPEHNQISNFLLCFGSINLLVGAGDYLNVFNALVQMPKGAVTQMSGFHSYWYLKDNPELRKQNAE